MVLFEKAFVDQAYQIERLKSKINPLDNSIEERKEFTFIPQVKEVEIQTEEEIVAKDKDEKSSSPSPHEIIQYMSQKRKEHDNADNIMRTDYCKIPEPFECKDEFTPQNPEFSPTFSKSKDLNNTPIKEIRKSLEKFSFKDEEMEEIPEENDQVLEEKSMKEDEKEKVKKQEKSQKLAHKEIKKRDQKEEEKKVEKEKDNKEEEILRKGILKKKASKKDAKKRKEKEVNPTILPQRRSKRIQNNIRKSQKGYISKNNYTKNLKASKEEISEYLRQKVLTQKNDSSSEISSDENNQKEDNSVKENSSDDCKPMKVLVEGVVKEPSKSLRN